MYNQKPYTSLFPISSLIYRVAVVILSASIVFSEQNIWSKWWYLLCGIFYLGSIVFCYNIKNAEIRGILDFVLINIILWGKNISDPLNYFYIITPILSSVFYTGAHRSIFSIFIFTELSIIIHCVSYIHITWLLPPLMLYGICMLYENRRQWMAYSQDINLAIDNFFCKPESVSQPHKILNPILDKLTIITKKQCINSISIYLLTDRWGGYLINSSKFIWYRSLRISDKEMDHLVSNKVLMRRIQNDSAKVDNFERLCLIEIENTTYIVKYEYTPIERLWFLMKLGFSNLLDGIAGKLARMFDLRYKVLQQQVRESLEFRKTKRYIDQAIGVMHFIRNKLTPMLTLLEYENLSESEKKLIPYKRYEKLLRAANKDIQDIKSRADSLLDAANYPFKINDNEEISINEIFTLLSESAEARMNITVSLKGDEPSGQYVFIGNKAEINVLFADWISNMEKYGENQKIEFSVDDKLLIITFYNTSKNTEIQDVLNIINSQHIKSSLTNKKTHGISTMKEIAQTYKISMQAKHITEENSSEKIIMLELKLPIYEQIEENINN